MNQLLRLYRSALDTDETFSMQASSAFEWIFDLCIGRSEQTCHRHITYQQVEFYMHEIWSGTFSKMRTEATDPVTYHLMDGCFDCTARADELVVNALLGKQVRITFEGNIRCVACGRKTKKTFNQGYCFPCSQKLPETDICMIKPELCHYFNTEKPCRDEAFAQRVCFKPHVLYISLTSGFKVGITRRQNVPSRWMDQGAVRAIPLGEMPSRRDVGLLEIQLAKNFQDKTHWMRMLKEKSPEGDIQQAADTLMGMIEEIAPEGFEPRPTRELHEFHYPVTEYPEKVKSVNLDKIPEVEGTLLGIKAQYWILDCGVINIRKYTGYEVTLYSD
ncbi:MAG: DUF2797 domain-containing protein [Pseudomonadales bacterium]|nr:DUF2797 domain-containing protein [Pseudomonadales bacterium]